ncbi:MAG: helix-turn-helix domain-containing protein [Inquilinus limosus]|uniref:Helix-turn-helix domain-containing protein n=1 Tax=Inquilinus limosus TaxID=171674 RepID=A0A952FLC4_9PROT|nr:helix-turn-helix domain-containing protein [Inquilinus limosus]
MSGRGAERILDLLEWLSARAEPASLADVAQTLDLPKSSTLLLLRLLVERRYAERLADGRYRLVRLPGDRPEGREAWNALLRLAAPHLDRAVEESGESVFVAVLDGDAIRYLNKLLPAREIQYDRNIGPTRIPHQVSSGVALLSSLPAEALEAYCGRLGLDPGQRRELLSRTEATAREGFHFNPQGVVEGASGVAAPILDGTGRAVAALNISGPHPRVVANLPKITRAVLAGAQAISAELAKRSSNRSGRSTRT